MPDRGEWEDQRIFLSADEAIAESKKYPKRRVEIFDQEKELGPFEPTYRYYQNGFTYENGILTLEDVVQKF
jgi:hypothetical protein